MIKRVHPLTGEYTAAATMPVADRPTLHARFTKNRGARLSYDAARSGTDLDGHWAFADARDADSANDRATREKLRNRSRYEDGSNGYYSGILNTHCNMLMGGTGPTLRMTTKNREFNQLVEREWYKFTQRVQLRRKLWAMAHARTMDGEAFGIITNDPEQFDGPQIDLTLIEAEQCQTPLLPHNDPSYLDGIKLDGSNRPLWYDILPHHPGGSYAYTITVNPIPVPANLVLHWFKLIRPGSHRGKPDLTSTLNVGASSRRWREATIAAAETAADIAAMLTSSIPPNSDSEPDPVAPFTSVEFTKRMLMIAPMGWDAKQMRGEHPNANHAEFNRSLISEQARPLSMPYNAAACDSSTYSFASGKLDTLCYRAALDVERRDCNDMVLEPLFVEWYREWTIVENRRDIIPDHQWDWPAHPVIDAVAEASATDTRLKNGTVSLRQVYSDNGQDFEDELLVMAEDMFGEATDETINKARMISVLRNSPQAALPFIAQVLGLEPLNQPQEKQEKPGDKANEPAKAPR